MSLSATYVSSYQFTVDLDQTGSFVPGRSVRMNCGVDGYKYGYVDSSAYSTLTTVTLLSSESDALTENLESVDYSSVKPDSTNTGNLGIHVPIMLRGWVSGLVISIKDSDEIYISSGGIHISDGTYERVYLSPSVITKQLTGLSVSTRYAVYLKPPTSGLTISSDCVEYSSTLAAESASKQGWYHPSNTTWRCIGYVTTDSGGLITSREVLGGAVLTGRTYGQILCGGTGSGENLTFTSTSNATKGSILFGSSGYDEANNRLGVGTSAPSSRLHSLATTEQLRLGYDASNYNAFTVGSTGSLTIAATGTNPSITLTPGGTGVVAASSNLTITGSSNSIATVGSELISASDDRTFASDTGAWTKGANWTIGSGVATHTAGANNLTYTGLTPTAGASYQIKATVVTTVAGTLTPQIGGVSGSAVGQSTGTLTQHVWVIVGTNTTQFSFVPSSAWAGTIDDVTITQITPSTSILNLKNSDATSGPEFRSGGSGINVTAIGIDSGKHRITGSNAATLIGYRAGYLSTTGAQTAIGHQSGYSNTTGTQTAIGHQAGYSNTTGNQTAIGYQSGYSNTTGYQTAIGYQSGYSNTTGYQTAIGQSAGYSNTTGYQTALGYQAGYYNTTGAQTAIGYQAGYYNTTGYQTAIGHLAGYSNTTGTQTAIGYYSDHLAPTAITTSNAVAYAGSGVDAGTHRYRVVFVLTGGDTAGSDSKSVTTTSDNDQVDLSGIPTYVGPKTCTARKIYRTKATSSSSPYYLVATISDNTTTTYSDTTPDASISTLLPSPNAMAIGYQAKTIFSNDVVFGSDTGPASNIYFGKGIYSATPTTTTIYGTGGLGTDIAGAGLYLAGGKGTGTGNGGDVRIQVALPGSSGTTENSLTDVLNVIGSTGYVGIGTATASAKLHSLATTEQLRLGYDASNYNAFTVGSTGSLTIAATGTNPSITLTPGGTGTVSIAGNVGIGTSKLGFYGATPASKPSAYTVSNASEDRAYDANATTLDEIADVLGTLISDLKTLGLIG